jgi:adenine phosphoribosyltransferase
MSTLLAELKAAIRDVLDFPRPGVTFKDITPVLRNGPLFQFAVHAMADICKKEAIVKIAAVEARGFIFGAAIASYLGMGFVPIRKKGKLPFQTRFTQYSLEYGTAEIEVHKDAFFPQERVCVVDDVLATGGTASAAVRLVRESGALPIFVQCFIELSHLNGRAQLEPMRVFSLIRF